MIARAGKVPAATTIVPAYDIPDQRPVRSMMYPTMPIAELPIMNGALRLVFSANMVMDKVVMKATTWGGTESSCACVAL